MNGQCMCADIYCSSCGPAQGNYHCPYCNSWSIDQSYEEDNGEVANFNPIHPETGCLCTPEEMDEYCKAEQTDDEQWRESMVQEILDEEYSTTKFANEN